MSTRETGVYTRLRERVGRPTDRWTRIENGLGDGTPDVNYCAAGREGWIEIKAPIEPARPTTAMFGNGNHQVSVGQANWLLAQSNAGGVAWLFIASEQRLILLPGKIVGEMGIKINKLTAHELEQRAAWKVLLPLMDPLRWADLREVLTA